MAISSFRDLLVYQKAYALSLKIHHATLTFPQFEQYELGRQMRKASKSICLNLAEGYGKSKASKIEFKRYVQVSLGSAEEMQSCSDYCIDLNYISKSEYTEFTEGYKEVSKMLQGLHSSWN